jgi:hypothetical protein
MRGQSFADDVRQSFVIMLVEAVEYSSSHARIPESTYVIGDILHCLLTIRHALEKSTNLVRHCDQVVDIHR